MTNNKKLSVPNHHYRQPLKFGPPMSLESAKQAEKQHLRMRNQIIADSKTEHEKRVKIMSHARDRADAKHQAATDKVWSNSHHNNP